MRYFHAFIASALVFLSFVSSAQIELNTFVRSFNATVNAVEVDQARGRAYFAGEFSTYAGARNGGEIFDENQMRPSYNLPWVPYVDITVDDGEGGWIIATDYFEGIDVSSTQNYQFIQIHPDGSYTDLPHDIPTQQAGWNVDEMIRYENYIIYSVGYDLTIFDWHTGEVVMTASANQWIRSLNVYDNVLYVTGYFTAMEGQPRNSVAAFDLSNFQLTDWNPVVDYFTSLTAQAEVTEMALTSSHAYFLIAKSYYFGSNSYTYFKIVKLNRADDSFIELIDFYTMNSAAFLTVWNDRILVSEYYTSSGMPYSTRIHSFADTEIYDEATHQVIEFDGMLSSMILRNDELLLSGGFNEILGNVRKSIAALNPADLTVLPLNLPFNGTTTSFKQIVPGDGGYFITSDTGLLGGFAASYFATIDLNSGELVPSNLEIISEVLDMALTTTGDTLFMAASGPTVNMLGAQRLIAINPVNQTVYNWVTSTPTLTSVNLADNHVFIQFTSTNASVNGQGRSRIASFNQTTLELEPVLISINGEITDFEVSGDTLLIAGPFTNVNSTARSTVAMLNKNTFAVLPWDAPLTSIFMVQYPSVSSSARLVKMHNGNVLLGGWFGPNTGQTSNSITAYFSGSTGARLPGYDSPVLGNIVYVRNWEQRGNLQYIAGNYFNTTGPTTGALSAIDLSNGQFVNLNVGAPGGIAGATDVAIYNNQLLLVGEYSSMNGDFDYRFCTSWNLGCSPGTLSIPAELNHCSGQDLTVASSWGIAMPETYVWEWSTDGGVTWNDLDVTTAMLTIYNAGMEYSSSLLRVQGISECDTALSNVATVNVQYGQNIGASISDATVCQGGVVAFNAPIAVSWSNGAITGSPMSLNVLGDGYVVATSTQGCYMADTVNYMVLSNPTLGYMILDSLNCDGANGVVLLQGAGGTAPYTYLNANSTIINAFVSGVYNYDLFAVRDANYCMAEVTVDLPLSSLCYGCMDPLASNYNPSAIFEETCQYLYTTCEYDLSGDGQIGVADLNLLLSQFGCFGDCSADFDGDQVVGVSDIYYVIQYFNYLCQ